MGRPLSSEEIDRIHDAVLRAKRHTFLGTGFTHPRFVELLEEVSTPAQRERIGTAAAPILAA